MLVIIHVVNIRYNSKMQVKKPRNPADFPVLGFLFRGPAHGYDLCREMRERLGEVWRLRTSHIYALLAGLEKDGLVRHERVDQETRPAKKVFSITDEGRLAFLVWVRSPVTNVRDIRLDFLAKLYFSRFDSPTALVDLIANQLSVCRSNIKRLTNSRLLCKTDTERAALDYRLAMLSAVEAWLIGLSEPQHHDSGGEFDGSPASRAGSDSGISV
jgi:PadR family transcriptional regulator, regulatory protein AphA